MPDSKQVVKVGNPLGNIQSRGINEEPQNSINDISALVLLESLYYVHIYRTKRSFSLFEA